jgi:hypothetical protein
MHYVRIYNLIESNIINCLFLVLIFMLQTRIKLSTRSTNGESDSGILNLMYL